MNKRQRKKLFTGYYKVVSKNPISHGFLLGEKVKVLSIEKSKYNGYTSVEVVGASGLNQYVAIEQIRQMYKKRPTSGCSH